MKWKYSLITATAVISLAVFSPFQRMALAHPEGPHTPEQFCEHMSEFLKNPVHQKTVPEKPLAPHKGKITSLILAEEISPKKF